MKRVYVSLIIGSGTEADPFRPKVADVPGISWSALNPSRPGQSRKAWTLAIVGAASHTALLNDADLDAFPNVALTTLISSLSNQVRNRLQTGLDRRGIAVTVNSLTTVGDLVQAIGQELQPGFTPASLDVAE